MEDEMNKTYKVWLEIKEWDEISGTSQDVDAPGASICEFATHNAAFDYVEMATAPSPCIVGLSAKGIARADQSGFVVRTNAA